MCVNSKSVLLRLSNVDFCRHPVAHTTQYVRAFLFRIFALAVKSTAC